MTVARVLRLRYLVPILVLPGLGWLALAYWRQAGGVGAHDVLHTVERGDLEETLLINGLVKPAVTIEVRAEASGIAETVHVNEGDRVSAGQVLVTLDSRVAQSAVQEAEASLRQAQLQETAARLDLDEDTVSLRESELRRQQALFERGLTSASSVEVAQHQLRVAHRTLERARRNLESNGARIEQLQAAVERAEAQLQHTIIRSPLDAWVIRRQVEIGSGVAGVSQSTAGGTVLMMLGDAREASLSGKVTAGDAAKLHPGLEARIRLDSEPGRIITGRVQMVSAAGDVDPQTRLTTFPVTIAVTNEEGAAWINIPGQAEVVIGIHEDVLVVPSHCLTTDAAGKTTVTLRLGDRDTPRPVEVGTVAEEQVEVTSGVDVGDTLLCRGTGAGR